MATLGTMRTRIADELQIDATTFATEIDRAIFSAIAYYNDSDYWFMDATPTKVVFSLTSQYSLTTLLPGRSSIKDIVLELVPSRTPMLPVTLEQWLSLDYDDNFTGEPTYWAIDHDSLMVLPSPGRTYTAVVWYSLQNSMTASASASSVWTTEAEELIRLHAEIDVLENRMKDFAEAANKRPRLNEIRYKMDEKTVVRRSSRQVKPYL